MMRLLSLTILLLLAALPAAPLARAQANLPICREACDERCLAETTRLYEFGFFEDAIAQLEPCLREQMRFGNRDQATRAYRLTALSYFEQGDLDMSRYWIERLMKEDRTYSSNETDPLFFREEVEEARPVRFYRRSWIWAPSLAAVAASGLACVLTACLVSDPEPIPPLSLPPAFPGGQ